MEDDNSSLTKDITWADQRPNSEPYARRRRVEPETSKQGLLSNPYVGSTRPLEPSRDKRGMVVFCVLLLVALAAVATGITIVRLFANGDAGA